METAGRPEEWAANEVLKSWLYREGEDLHTGTFDDGALWTTQRLLYPDNTASAGSGYSPLFVPFGCSGGVCVGTLYGGRSVLTRQFPLGHKVLSRFAMDMRNERVTMYMSHAPEDSDLMELMRLDVDDAGDMSIKLAIFERGSRGMVHFLFQTTEKRDCAFCSARGFICDCSDKMRRSALPSLSLSLREEFTALSLAPNVRDAWQNTREIMQQTYAGTFRVAGTKRFGDTVVPFEPFQKQYRCETDGSLVAATTIHYAQSLVAERRPVSLKLISSYCTDNELSGAMIVSRSQDERVDDDLVLDDLQSGNSVQRSEDAERQKERALSGAEERVDGMFVCGWGDCHAKFARKFDMQRHVRSVHHGERFFDCKQCTKRFVQKSHLREHVQSVHQKMRSASCPECGKSFSTKSKANRHVLSVHRNQRNFQCHICEHKFFQRWDLQKHLETHE